MLTLTCKELPTLLYTSRSRKKIQNLCTKVRLRQALYTSCETHTIVLMPRFDVNNFFLSRNHINACPGNERKIIGEVLYFIICLSLKDLHKEKTCIL